jgi:streptogramin lyase
VVVVIGVLVPAGTSPADAVPPGTHVESVTVQSVVGVVLEPAGIVTGPDGSMWFANTEGDSIGRITPDGAISGYGNDAISEPVGIALGPDGNLWFTNTGAGSIGRITPDGELAFFAHPEIEQPWGIVVGPKDTLWFTDRAGGKVATITSLGFIDVVAEVPEPVGLVEGGDGNLWVTSYGDSAIWRVTPEGDTTDFTERDISFPWAITAGPDGNLWFTDRETDVIGRMTTSGTTTFFSDGVDDPRGITPGPDGNLWFANHGDDTIGRITPAGVVTTFPTGGRGPSGITTGPDGRVWFTTSTDNLVGASTVDGTVTTYRSDLHWSYGGARRLTEGPDGNMWFARFEEDEVGWVSPTGAVTTFAAPAIDQPLSITTGPDGNLWFTNVAGSIGRITPGGVATGYSTAGMVYPVDIVVGPDDNLWFTDPVGGAIGRITTAGQITLFTDPAMVAPTFLTVGPDDALWFTESFPGGTVGRITTSGAVSTFGGHDFPVHIVAGSDGNLWFMELGANSITRISPTGEVVAHPIPVQLHGGGLALGPDGNVWFALETLGSIGRITPAGQVTVVTAPTLGRVEALTAGSDGWLWFATDPSFGSYTSQRDALGRFDPAAVPLPDPPPPPGLLRVATDPAVGARVFVDGTPRNDWGLDWVRPGAGSREVCFSDVVGFATPECVTADVVDGTTALVTGEFAPLGSLRVQVTPAGLPATIFVNGTPRNDYGMWAFTAPGTYEVCWGEVEGYTAPACEQVEVVAGEVTTVAGEFVAGGPGGSPAPDLGTHGYLRVTTDPPLPAQIVVDGVVRNDWGLDWVKFPAGSHEVCLTDVPGFAAPPCQTVTVFGDSTTTYDATFTALGLLKVDVAPAGLPTDVVVDGLPANQFGSFAWREPGDYEVCWTPVDGFVTPACETVAVTAGALTEVTGTFAEP